MSTYGIPCTIRITDRMYFTIATLCGQTHMGMTNTDDLQICTRRALDHASQCEACAQRWQVLSTPGTFVSTGEVD